MQVVATDGLTIRVRLLDEPSLWCWEISETESGRIVETSWSSEWMAYDSYDEALAAGQRRLAELGMPDLFEVPDDLQGSRTLDLVLIRPVSKRSQRRERR